MKRRVIIPDVHGCIEELLDLLAQLDLGPTDWVGLLGDLPSKGPDPLAVIQTLKALLQRVPGVYVRGNHEQSVLNWLRSQERAAAGEDVVKRLDRRGDDARLGPLLKPDDIAFLKSSVLWAPVPGMNAIMVHGGIPPLMEALPDPDPDAGSSKERKEAHALLRMRFVTGVPEVQRSVRFHNARGKRVGSRITLKPGEPLPEAPEGLERRVFEKDVPVGTPRKTGEEQSTDVFWAESYDGRFGHVFFGHNPWDPAEAPVEFPHATGMDLGAVFGNRLTAVVFDEQGRKSFVSARSRRSYSAKFY